MTDTQESVDFDDIFDDNADSSKSEPAEEYSEQEFEEQGADEKGEKESRDEESQEDDQSSDEEDSDSEDAETPAAEEQKSVPIAALQDERRKRQELEERLQKFEQSQQQQAEDAPDPVKDPQGYKEYVRNQVVQEQFQQRIETSRSKMLETAEDYTEMEETFAFLAQKNPDLSKELLTHPDPARFAYDIAKKHFDDQRSKILAEERDKMKAEILAELNQTPQPSESERRKKSAAGVPNLTKAASVAGNTAKVEKMEDFDAMFADQKY